MPGYPGYPGYPGHPGDESSTPADLGVDAHDRFVSVAGDSPVDAAVPFWITACVRLAPPRRRNGAEVSPALANAVFPAVQALIADRLRTDDAAAVPLNRDRVARRAGLGEAKKAGWLFDYLEQIGALRIQRHYPGPGRGREADTFTVFTRPPLHYVGPRTHAELEYALDHPGRVLAGVLFIDESPGHPEGAGSGTFRAAVGAGSGTLVGETAGQPVGAGSGTYSVDQGAGSGTLVGETAGQGVGARFGTYHQIERSSISLEEREIEGSSAPARGSAPPPAPSTAGAAAAGFGGSGSVVGAAGLVERSGLDGRAEALTEALTEPFDESLRGEAREVVRRLPWAAWAQARGKTGWQFTPADADQVQTAICEAVSVHGLSWVEAGEIGQAALSEAKGAPVVYVVNAFTRHLARRRRALTAEPLAETPLPLLDVPARRDSPQRRSQRLEQAGQIQPAATGVDPVSVPEQVETSTPPTTPHPVSAAACGTCEARDGDGATMRTITGDDGRCLPCPTCRPCQSPAVPE